MTELFHRGKVNTGIYNTLDLEKTKENSQDVSVLTRDVNERVNMADTKTANLKDFEKSLENLEQIVQELEDGELSLEDSIKKYEKGVTLYKKCKSAIGKAEEKIQVLSDSLKTEELD